MIALLLGCILLESAVLHVLQEQPRVELTIERRWCPDPNRVTRRLVWRQDGVTFYPHEEAIEWVAPPLRPPLPSPPVPD